MFICHVDQRQRWTLTDNLPLKSPMSYNPKIIKQCKTHSERDTIHNLFESLGLSRVDLSRSSSWTFWLGVGAVISQVEAAPLSCRCGKDINTHVTFSEKTCTWALVFHSQNTFNITPSGAKSFLRASQALRRGILSGESPALPGESWRARANARTSLRKRVSCSTTPSRLPSSLDALVFCRCRQMHRRMKCTFFNMKWCVIIVYCHLNINL